MVMTEAASPNHSFTSSVSKNKGPLDLRIPHVLDDEEEEGGEHFEFDDEAPESERPPSFPPAVDYASSLQSFHVLEDAEADLPPPPAQTCPSIPHADFPPPPNEGQIQEVTDKELPLPPEGAEMPGANPGSQPKVNPYSVIDISPESPPSLSTASGNEVVNQEVPSSPGVHSGYSVPVPCGYATPSNVPIIMPTYTTPVIIRHYSVDEEVTVVGTGSSLIDGVFSEEHPAIREEDALAKWASDPANTAWMEKGGSSSVENGWSSSEFESYDEESDGESGHGDNGLLPNAFIRRHTPSTKTHHYERKVKDLMANAVGAVELQQLRHKHEQKQYETPLQGQDWSLLSERKCKVVFYRVREILQCHAIFQIALASRVSDWDQLQTIGDVFVASFSKSMVLDAYSEYVNNFSSAMTVLRKACASKPCFLDFLKDMLKNTPVGHADRLPLQMALTELETLSEKLNERKREADQRCSRYLIRSDDVVETVYNERGEIIKTKERQLFLLNDVLMCATPNLRSPQDGGGAIVPSGQRFLLKWSVPLSLVDLVEFGSSEEIGDSAPFPAPHSGEKVVINAKPSPGQLYQDLQNLIHDLGLVNQISTMISSLKGNYQVRDPAVSGRPTFFTAVFNTTSPSVKQAWISNLQMAKLALGTSLSSFSCIPVPLHAPDNRTIVYSPSDDGWFIADDDGNQIKKQKHPLLLKHLPVVMSRLQEFKVECAVHNPEPHITSESTADVPVVGHGCVWVASCTNQMAQIAVVAMQNSSPKVTECFNVESRILCMTYVPMVEPLESGLGNPETRSCNTPTVCVGTEEGSISVYKSSQRSKKVRLQHFFTPDKAAVTCLAYRSPFLYAGLVSGSLAVYSRAPDGSWDSSGVRLLKLAVLPVKSLLAVGECVWASSGGQVFIIDARTHTLEHQLEAHQEEGMVVSQMVVAGVGIWIAFSSGSTLRLFHIETLEHLQDINIATPVHNILSGHQRVSVSSLLVCHGLLLVGTNLGVTVALSVPRLQGIPKVTGRGMVSFHAHHSPVKFLIMASPVQNTVPAISEPLSQCVFPPEEDGAPGGDGVHSSPMLQDSLSSSRSSLEHGPEDGTIYDLLSDPALSQNTKRNTQRLNFSSVLVLSGGSGHRRINRKSKGAKHEENMPTVMVWQIPMTDV
ncbi:Rho guanine nucleotide exchange factor 10 [Bagarius yarrelli]|uniref:Rho guanine nucleotide exchange factor 10 n=1 Tax=Bagarius yarrelli TaxID=175774 RepID=A0A556V2U9_BAGYA|nr:Rho guanine nucleotide exchange factor 10 [Bagarius yarrelli]